MIGNLHYVWLLRKKVSASCLCFTATTAGSTIAMKRQSTMPWPLDLQYSLNGRTWIAYEPQTDPVYITLANAGDKIYWKGVNPDGFSYSGTRYYQFRMTGSFEASGSVMSLIDGVGTSTTIPSTWAFNRLFHSCTSLITPPALPATELTQGCYSYMFTGCTSLTVPPELPATELVDNCYQGLLQGCTSITSAPALPSTTTTHACYLNMFNGCVSLITPPELPATTIVDNCYQFMFSGCTALTSIPELPATTLAMRCYYGMFKGCTSLPNLSHYILPATTLADNCYYQMFQNTNLTNAPVMVAATTMYPSCYYSMFEGCTSLLNPPILPAMTLASGCYSRMFYGCTNMTSLPALLATGTLPDTCYSNMFYGCTKIKLSTGSSSTYVNTYAIPIAGTATAGTDSLTDMFTGTGGTWTGTPTSGTTYYTSNSVGYPRLCFTANTAGSTISLTQVGTPTGTAPKYTTDWASWTTLTPGSTTITLANAGDKVYLKADNSSGFSLDSSNYYKFVMTGSIAASGDVMSLANKGSQIPGTGCFYNLFNGCTSLTTAPTLRAKFINNSCFSYMFNGCTGLTTAPMLPARTMATACYQAMFKGCNHITSAPELPATSLANYCYQYMFSSCTRLTTPSDLPSLNLATCCYQFMYQDCTGLTSVPNLPATTLTESCYHGMYWNCTSITSVPVAYLPAMTVAVSCYRRMFQGCTSLTAPPALPANVLASYCYGSIFEGCTNLNKVVVLPATVFPSYCYTRMYYGCSKIKISEESASGYTNAYRIPRSGSASAGGTSWNLDAFVNTGGTYTGSITRNHTYYTSNALVYPRLGLTAQTAGVTISMAKVNTPAVTPNMQYSTNGTTWTTFTPGTTTITLAKIGDGVHFRGTNSTSFSGPDDNNYWKFVMTGSVAASGSVMSLVDGTGDTTTIPSSTYYFYGLFYNCTGLTTPPALPATTVYNGCYQHMFRGCSNLTSAPALPATTLAGACYYGMFRGGCTKLTTVPKLPATTLATYCYCYMFADSGVTSLPALAATSLPSRCYRHMFYNCSKIKLSTTQTGDYQTAYRIPKSGTGTVGTDSLTSMFTSTGGTFADTPSVNTTYYTSNTIVQ